VIDVPAAPELERSIAEQIATLPDPAAALAELVATDSEAEALEWDWSFWARPKQLLPLGDWFVWFIQSGRGFGKTRSGAEAVIQWAKEGHSPIALVGSTAADVRDTMVEVGEASILKHSPPWFYPHYEPSKRRLTWPNGVIAICYGADEPETFRGPQHAKGWCDEIAKWKRLKEAWQNIVFGMRVGAKPQIVATSTPKPKKLLRELVRKKSTKVTRGSMYENRGNLPDVFLAEIEDAFAGTRTGRQEIEGELLDEAEGALWTRAVIDRNRRRKRRDDYRRIVVAIDPAAGSGPDSNDTGIVGAGSWMHELSAGDAETGKKAKKRLEHDVLADRTCHLPPEGWARQAIALLEELGGDAIVAEINNGGEMVKSTIHAVDATVKVRVVHATRGKVVRAEPISALYEQGRVHHIGRLDELEDQQVQFTQEKVDTSERDEEQSDSPDRVDALVWCLTELHEKASWGAS
jgi:phage terminase large subunit-like protein